ncbi:Initiation-specific alpha-1,6-mannosyltransferase, partial [Lasiodiplodia theobromae]|uniref:Initiation-specific alpha-1,6-mannosyltransferase n=1 Tax=Lasiodiplodia theobromae TaxID=45133 RepID=UPI0015C2E3E6
MSDLSHSTMLEPFPKKIWQISHFAPEEKPYFIDDYQELWQLIHPTHQYQCLTEQNEDDFVRRAFHENDSARKMYFLIKDDAILRADFLRYLVLLVEGGVYTDMDTRPMQPIDVWIPEEFANRANIALGVEIDKGQGRLWRDMPWTVQMSQFTIMAKPNHPLLRHVVDSVGDNVSRFLEEHGPRLFTNAVFRYLSEQTGFEMNGDEVSGI